MSIFQKIKPLIEGNTNLFGPQIKAYDAAISHYKEFQDFKYRESLIVMPTGTGKTGVMAMLPFGLCNGRVLIITPGKIVRKTVFKEFDSIANPEQTFWYKRKVLLDRKKFPKSYLYKGFDSHLEGAKAQAIKKLEMADIVITNIHKLVGSSNGVNLKNLISENFFDMIIIDEAHHVAADMWQETLDYFKATKVIKLTATPFRGDQLEISTHPYDPVYEYTLAEAIEDGLLKNVVKSEEIPGEIEFYDESTHRKYTLEEAKKELGDKWVNRSIAMSERCSKQVIEYTKEILNLKRKSYPHHQVLAITCNDLHAQLVTQWFKECGLSCNYVSSKLQSDQEIETRLNDFANGHYDVMVSIQMLGEGYDNPNISVISIFRPFKTLSPYAQAIGRGLRRIRGQQLREIDNYCNVVYHQELGLEPLWNYYKTQESYGKSIKKQVQAITEQLSFTFDELGFVEKQTVKRNVKSSDPDVLPAILKVGGISTYESEGFGKLDSFTDTGYEDYLKAQYELVAELQKEVDGKIEKIHQLLLDGDISEEQEKILIHSLESKSQTHFDEAFNEYQDMIVAETLRKDFTIWMNSKFEEFFKISNLKKEGQDLYILEDSIDKAPISNIGFIVKNFNQTLYNDSKKNISLYLPKDFAMAKQRFIQKLDYYLNQYGKKNYEGDLT